MKASELFQNRINIITGHFGTGKTEFAVNLALSFAAEGLKTAIADLDIVNLYFRSRERRSILEDAGIRVICSSQQHEHADLPSLPADIMTLFEDRSYKVVLDLGGDPSGARVIARFLPRIQREDSRLFYVFNASRPEIATIDSAEEYLRRIEDVTGLECGGIINNTHLCEYTRAEDVLAGEEAAIRLSEKTGIPFICSVAWKRLLPTLSGNAFPLFPIEILMKKPWEVER
ncbi:MAG: hypothetical protein GX975_05395 [Clostridiales bacterium]|nr:hypothetical protein [Clostridiales bacterium]